MHISYQDTPNQLDIIREHGTRCHWTSFSVLNQVCTPQCDHGPPLPADDMRRFSPTDNKEGSSNQTLGSVDHPHHCAISENQLRRSLPPYTPYALAFDLAFKIVFNSLSICFDSSFPRRSQQSLSTPLSKHCYVSNLQKISSDRVSQPLLLTSGIIATINKSIGTNRECKTLPRD